jgi:hypothetical protein
MSSLSPAAKEAYASVDSIIVHTLEFRHSVFTNPIRVVRNNENLTLKLESNAPLNASEEVEFVALGFELKLPSIDKNKLPELTLEVDNIYSSDEDKYISDYVEETKGSLESIEITHRAYDAKTLTPAPEPIEVPFHLVLHDIKADIYKLSAKARFFNAQNEVFPKNTYSLDEFPTLSYT